MQFYPIITKVPFELDTKMKHNRAMINCPEPCRGTPDDFWDFGVPSRAEPSVHQTDPLNELKVCVRTLPTCWNDSSFLSMSRIGHFYKVKLLLEELDSRKKWRLFCGHFDDFLCITDQKWACQDGWSLKKGPRRIFWGMGYISKIFFRNPQSADP